MVPTLRANRANHPKGDFDTNGQTSMIASDSGALVVQSKVPVRPSPKRQPSRHPVISRKLHRQLADCFSFPERVLFLDIETTGLSHYYDEITIIGWSFGGCAKTLVKGGDPKPLYDDVVRAKALVTFNGIRFDTRFITRDFPDIVLPETHLDLRYLCRRVDLKGGQKAIENILGINFRGDLANMGGAEAVLLWHRYVRGNLDALRQLIRYNRIDVAAMGAILDEVITRIRPQLDLFTERVRFRDWSAPPGWQKLPRVSSPPRQLTERRLGFSDLFGTDSFAELRIVGIDLTGSEKRASGWCLLSGREAEVASKFSDEELIEATVNARPHLVSIDSPLCLPAGRLSVGDDDPKRAEFGIMRECERELKRRGVNVYPCLIPSMQKLTARGIRLARVFRERGIPVIESYPGAAQDIMRIPRKGAGLEWLKTGLREFGILGDYETQNVTHDELDAITSALVGTFHLAGMSEALGTDEEAPLIIPRLESSVTPFVVGISGPIAAGKTTLARVLERAGFAYARFSLVLDDILMDQKQPLTRTARQKLGGFINASGRQRWLTEKTIAKAGSAEKIVVDGLRFPDDNAFLVERFGMRFLHIYIDTDKETRRQRYSEFGEEVGFDEALNATVECRVAELCGLAHDIFVNQGSKLDVERCADGILDRVNGAQPCLSRS